MTCSDCNATLERAGYRYWCPRCRLPATALSDTAREFLQLSAEYLAYPCCEITTPRDATLSAGMGFFRRAVPGPQED